MTRTQKLILRAIARRAVAVGLGARLLQVAVAVTR